MFIQTESTPNPATLKFLPGQDVLGRGTADLATREEQITVANRVYADRGLQPWGCAHAACSWRCCCQASSDSLAMAGSAVASSSELATASASGRCDRERDERPYSG